MAGFEVTTEACALHIRSCRAQRASRVPHPRRDDQVGSATGILNMTKTFLTCPDSIVATDRRSGAPVMGTHRPALQLQDSDRQDSLAALKTSRRLNNGRPPEQQFSELSDNTAQ